MTLDFLFDNFFELTDHRSGPRGRSTRLIALGYTMVYGVLQLINFAHSEVFMYGTFAERLDGDGARRRRQLERSVR